MGMWAGQLTGLRARKQDDLNQNQFEQNRKDQDRRSDLSKKQFGLQSRMAYSDQQRDNERLALSKRAASQSEQTSRNETNLARYGNAYQAAAMGDPDTALRIWNQDRDRTQWADSIMVDDKKNMVISRRGDSAVVEYDKLRRFLPKDSVEYADAQKKTLSVQDKAETDFKEGTQIEDLAGIYDLSGVSAAKLKAISSGLRTGKPYSEIARNLGLKAKADTSKEKDEFAKVTSELAAHKEALKKGDTRYGLFNIRSREGAIGQLSEKQQELEDKLLQNDPDMRQAEKQIVSEFSGFDSNQDQKIDELDKDVQLAQKVVDRFKKSPESRSQAIERFGAAQVAEWEALVNALKKSSQIKANRRLGLGR